MYKAVKSMYEVVTARVRVGGYLTDVFVSSRGLKQGDSCSPDFVLPSYQRTCQ